jgi:hypothetical protein
VAQRFTLQAVMAMFAEDVGLLPRHSLSEALEDSIKAGRGFDLVFGLFREMNNPGITAAGRYQGTPYFNGGLLRPLRHAGDTPENTRNSPECSSSRCCFCMPSQKRPLPPAIASALDEQHIERRLIGGELFGHREGRALDPRSALVAAYGEFQKRCFDGSFSNARDKERMQ